MQTLLQLDKIKLAVQAESIEGHAQGAVLHGMRVSLLHPFGETLCYRHGWHSWSLSCWLPLSLKLSTPLAKSLWPQIDHPALLEDYPFTSSSLTALQAPDGKVLLLGALGLDARLKVDTEMVRGEYVAPKAADLEWFLAFGEERTVFAAYAGMLEQRLGARGHGQPWRVWCSWYGLYTGISEDILLGVLPGLKDLPFDVFQVDDGWQVSLGDWEANEKFPSGMQVLARKIRASGYVPGLWLAPLAVAPTSRLFQEHPEWLLRDADGKLVPAGHNWGDDFYGLDVTRPGVQKWLTERIQQVRFWGFDYLKLDFLYAGALPGARYQKLPGELALRKALEIIRQAAGEVAYLLTCGVPMLASLGLADGLRVGPDVAPQWENTDRSYFLHDFSGPGVLNAIRTTLHRLWLRPLAQVDPDVAYFREKYNLLTSEQKAVLQDLVQVTGFRATSDLPVWLSPEERQALHAFLSHNPQITQTGRYQFNIDNRPVDFGVLEGLWPD
ncbi:MAG: alpha-galactosidase [Chloroflexi bacterium RBG_16_57_11]|nr:MAG: alpha-galactosidase [Chloroflexi bacterium RBG_16_57_11]